MFEAELDGDSADIFWINGRGYHLADRASLRAMTALEHASATYVRTSSRREAIPIGAAGRLPGRRDARRR